MAAMAQTAPRGKRLEGPFAARANVADRMPMLRLTLERAGELCGEGLQELVAEPPGMALIGIESASGDELLAKAGSAIVSGLLRAPKWDACVLVTVRQDAILALVEMMLGGDGSEAADLGTRPLSKIETGVARLFYARLAKSLEGAFATVAATEFEVEEVQDDLDLELLGGPGAPLAVAKYHFEFCGRGGEIQVAIPQAALTPMRTALSVVPKKERTRPADPNWAQRIEQEITRSKVVLSAILDERPMMLGEIMGLEVGQVLHLGATADSRVRIECNNERLMWAHLGKSNGVYTLRVDQYVDQEQEFMDEILAG